VYQNGLFLRRHNITMEEFKEISTNSVTDYHNKPIPVLIQPKIAENLINTIVEYNLQNNTNFGFNVSSILSLVQIKKNKKKCLRVFFIIIILYESHIFWYVSCCSIYHG